jgi:thioredoxin
MNTLLKRASSLILTAVSLTTTVVAHVVPVTKQNAQSIIEKSKESIVIIDFYADWCAPCKQMAPIFEQVSEKYKNYVFAKANIEHVQELMQEFGVMNLPSFVVIKNGKKIGTIVGARSAEDFEAEMTALAQEKGLETLTKEQLQQRMLQAIMGCDIDSVKAITSVKSFDINAPLTIKAPMAEGNTVLGYAVMIASQFGDKGKEMIKVLLDAGANPNYMFTEGDKSIALIDVFAQMHENTKRVTENQKDILDLMKTYANKNKSITTSTAQKTVA